MEIKKSLFFVSFVVTSFLFITIIIFGSILNQLREQSIDNRFETMSKDLTDTRVSKGGVL